MDSILQAQFQRVETAFTTLIDSISAYTPNQQAAVDLVAADDDLSKGLDQLAQHQSNYTRILTLRQTVSELETQVKGSLTTLADLRNQLLATPATTFPESSRSVPFNELLAYARHISDFTVPPTYRPPPPEENATTTEPAAETGEVKVSDGVDGTPSAEATQETTKEPSEKEKGKGWGLLTQHQQDFVDNQSKLPFVPWPTEDKIRGGALAQIQLMVEKGMDPSTVLGPAEQQAEDKRRAEEEERAKQEREEREAEEMRRRESMYASGGGRGREQQQQHQPAVFTGLDMYDADDE